MAAKSEEAVAREGWQAATAEMGAARKWMEAQAERSATDNNQLVRVVLPSCQTKCLTKCFRLCTGWIF